MLSGTWIKLKYTATVGLIAGLIGAVITLALYENKVEYINTPPPVLFTNSMDTTDVAFTADDIYLWRLDGRFTHLFWKSNGRGGYQLQAPTINPDTIGLSDSIARADSIALADSGGVGQ